MGDEPLASVRAKNGGSALHLAAFAGQLNTAQWLVERGVPVTGVDGGGGTPLHAACFAGNLAVCGWLASSGADIEAADGRGARPLHVACLAGREQVVDLLLRRGALKMCKTRDGATPAALARKASQINARTSWRASSGRPAPRRAAPPVVKRPRPAPVPVPRAGPAPPAPPPLGALQAQMLGIQPAAPPPAQPPLAAAVAAVPQVQAPPPTTARLGVTPSQATDALCPSRPRPRTTRRARTRRSRPWEDGAARRRDARANLVAAGRPADVRRTLRRDMASVQVAGEASRRWRRVVIAPVGWS